MRTLPPIVPTGQYARSQDKASRSRAVSRVAETATQPRT